jgi:hypothetical protein
VPDQREEHELFEVHWIDFNEAQQRALDGRIRDSKTVVALLRAAALRDAA